MKRIGNLIWLIPYGIIFTGLHLLLGILCCLSIIFIPFGLQHFKLIKYTRKPFGRVAYTDFDERPIMNIFWLIFGGWFIPVLVHVLVGTALCITIIGIPFAKKCFRLASLTFIPFGSVIV
jgi:uncharacterized membrane protein YccF (DUF307 family)